MKSNSNSFKANLAKNFLNNYRDDEKNNNRR